MRLSKEKMKFLEAFMMLLTSSYFGFMRSQISSIYFYEKTVKKLSDEDKNQYHLENMIAAEMVLVDKNKMPKTHEGLKQWVIEKSKEKDYLIHTDVAKDVQDIIAGGPVPTHIKPIWPFIAFTAFHTLPKEFKDLYKIKPHH